MPEKDQHKYIGMSQFPKLQDKPVIKSSPLRTDFGNKLELWNTVKTLCGMFKSSVGNPLISRSYNELYEAVVATRGEPLPPHLQVPWQDALKHCTDVERPSDIDSDFILNATLDILKYKFSQLSNAVRTQWKEYVLNCAKPVRQGEKSEVGKLFAHISKQDNAFLPLRFLNV